MTRFFKVSGSGNDFLALPEPAAAPAPASIRAWCRRGVSVGADGLFVLRRGSGSGDAAGGDRFEGGEVLMDYWNADGRPADLCLNGTRCAAQLAFHLGWSAGRVTVATPAGRFAAHHLDDCRVALELAAPPAPEPLAITAAGASWSGWRIQVGVPHFVLAWPRELDGDGAPAVVELGRTLRRHEAFAPAGTNVNFVRYPAEHQLEIRTYERGVEDETLSCGTGVLAAAAVGLASGHTRLPVEAATRGGFALTVEAGADGARWRLAGDARVVAAGELLPGAEAGGG